MNPGSEVGDDGRRVAVVTGASRGIGEAVARRLAADGCAVILAARDADRLTAIAGEIEADGGVAFARPADVTSEDDVGGLVGEAVERFGRLDVAVNNAGGGGGGKVSIDELDRARFETGIELNLLGTYNSVHHESRAMIAGGRGGAIVNVSSGAGLRAPSDGIAPYVAAKHGVQGLTKSAALDLAGHGIRVNAVAPGPIATGVLADNDQAREQASGWVPLGRVGSPAEVAAAIAWLCSEDASFVSGATLEVDGGMAARG